MGPVEFLVLTFPGASPGPGAIRAFDGLRRSGAVRVIDSLLVVKATDGSVTPLELAEVGELAGLVQPDESALIDADDAEEVGLTLDPDTCALLALVEQTWAADAAEAGGELTASVRIPTEVVGEALTSLGAS
jgi:hypothetical protein